MFLTLSAKPGVSAIVIFFANRLAMGTEKLGVRARMAMSILRDFSRAGGLEFCQMKKSHTREDLRNRNGANRGVARGLERSLLLYAWKAIVLWDIYHENCFLNWYKRRYIGLAFPSKADVD